MKIGIITLYGNYNFGNKLQNYALLKVIENTVEDCNVVTLYKKDKYNLKKLVRKFLSTKGYKREKKFMNFNKYLHLKQYHKSSKNNYDYIFVGSDQVWNYNFDDFDPKYYFAKEFDNSIICSYAASLGVSTIDKEHEKIFVEGLNGFSYISVREQQAAIELERITGKNDIQVVLDPTMLISTTEWEKLAKKPSMLKNDKYILNYFLGDLSLDKKKEIEKFAMLNECEIVNIFDRNSDYYLCGPEEFLYLVKNAYLVCTDSFHSTVFSILFSKPFIVFDRDDKLNSMSSRLDNLLNLLELQERKFNGLINNSVMVYDYSNANKILEREKHRSIKFIEDSIKKNR